MHTLSSTIRIHNSHPFERYPWRTSVGESSSYAFFAPAGSSFFHFQERSQRSSVERQKRGFFRAGRKLVTSLEDSNVCVNMCIEICDVCSNKHTVRLACDQDGYVHSELRLEPNFRKVGRARFRFFLMKTRSYRFFVICYTL
jgi:hypothetical protein